MPLLPQTKNERVFRTGCGIDARVTLFARADINRRADRTATRTTTPRHAEAGNDQIEHLGNYSLHSNVQCTVGTSIHDLSLYQFFFS